MFTKLIDTEAERQVSEVLKHYFEQSIIDASIISPSYQQLWNSLQILFLSGGKRLRSKMLIMSYCAFNGDEIEKVIPIAAAQELLHYCLLIHDDIIDRDYVRYGTENIAGMYKKIYAEHISTPEEATHFAHSTAILGGDLMLSGAYRLIAESSLTEEKRAIAQALLSKAVFEVAGGELLDTELSFKPYTSGDAVIVAQYKTASYTFSTPLLSGANLAGASPSQLDSLQEFSQSIGIAYQLVDDLLGVFGDDKETGKSTTSDITEGKQTYLVECALNIMNQSEKAEFTRAFGNLHATDEEIETAKRILEATGKNPTEELINVYKQKALNTIPTMQINESYSKDFEDLVYLVVGRSR